MRSRFAAVHVLRQLAMDSPTHFYVQVIRDVDIKDSFLEVMWTVLCDKSEARAHLSCPPNRRNHSLTISDGLQVIRRTTASALGACLEMVAQREGDHCQQLYAGVYNSALQRVGSSSDAVSTPTNRLGLRSVTEVGNRC